MRGTKKVLVFCDICGVWEYVVVVIEIQAFVQGLGSNIGSSTSFAAASWDSPVGGKIVAVVHIHSWRRRRRHAA